MGKPININIENNGASQWHPPKKLVLGKSKGVKPMGEKEYVLTTRDQTFL